MNCPLCGKTYPCAHGQSSAAPYESISVDVYPSGVTDTACENELWREQVASRVQQHRAKRKGAEPDPNMELRFPVQDAAVDPRVMRARRFVAQAATRSPFADDPFEAPTITVANTTEDTALAEATKIIHFPGSGGSRGGNRNVPGNALASIHDYHAAMVELEAEEPLLDSLRITDVGEVAPDEAVLQPAGLSGSPENSSSLANASIAYVADEDPPIVYRKAKAPPAEQLELPNFEPTNFDDIQLEATHQPVLPDLEAGPQPAPLGQRMMAGIVDAAIVLAAAAVFNVTFNQLAEESLHSRMALLCAVVVGGVLWTLYQYTFLVYGNGTPGMHLAQLELANFDGKPVSAFDRRCRAVASALSGFSLGLGFLWALVDEDQLGWHDRMTKTLIRSSAHQPAVVRETVW
jgi:uncharacterized RDD family membrane protein YckC